MVRFALLALLLPTEINGADSLEWLAYDCDVIVAGEVVLARGAELTIRVTETFKGPREKELTCVGPFMSPEERPKVATFDAVEYLFFLVKSERYLKDDAHKHEAYASAALALRAHGWSRMSAVRLDGKLRTGLFDAEFREHKERAAIFDALRRAVANQDLEKPASKAVDVPGDTPAYKALWSGSAVWLNTPLDRATRARARAWLLKVDAENHEVAADLLSRYDVEGDLPWVEANMACENRVFRLLALRAFAPRRSEKRVEFLKAMLNDASFDVLYAGEKIVGHAYPIRKEAFRILRDWGIPVTEPILERRFP